jgi:pimeloyl-ACP methyl ester carboxylesterase
VLRFDYPGAGLSATEEALPQQRTVELVAELCGWLVDETGIDRLAVAGRCAGGRLALAMPAVDERVTTSVSVVPFFATGGWSLRSKLAELDAKGPRLAQRLISAPRTERLREERQDPEEVAARFAEDLRIAAERARTSIVFGEHDPLLGDLRRFVTSRGLESAFGAIDLIVLPQARLHGLPNVDHERALGEVLVAQLAATQVSPG